MEIKVYNQKGDESGNMELSKDVFGLPENNDLVHQVVVSLQSNARNVIAHAKGRGEVRGGGRKPWRQKGTGRARHGSRRSPIWIGGGVTHGPVKEKVYDKKINKKMRAKALFTVLSQKFRDNEIIVLEDLSIDEPKTRKAAEILKGLSKIAGFEKLGGKRSNKAVFMVKTAKPDIKRSFANLYGTKFDTASNLNALEAMTYRYLVFTKDALSVFSKK